MDKSLSWILRVSTAAGLVSIVISHSLSTYLGNSNTRFSWLTSSQPRILLNDAESQITSRSESKASSEMPRAASANEADAPDTNLNRVRALASAALLLEPLSGRALRILGQATKDRENIRRFMDAAVATSLHESSAALWLIDFNFERKNYAETARLADVLLRAEPNTAAYPLGILGRMAETDGRSEVHKLLAQKPPWRPLFFQHLEWGISDARTPLELLLALQGDDAGPSSEEVQLYISFLMRNKLYDLAYYTWLLFLPEEQLSSTGLLANADFTFPLSGEAFDWDLKGAEGVRIGIDPEPDNPKKPALHLSFLGGRVGEHGVSQKLTLSPGDYRMSGRQMGNLVGPRGVRWQVSCLDSPSSPPLAVSPMLTGASQWARFELQIKVPNVACPAQEVRLYLDARSASERVVSGHIWFDGLNIQRNSKR